VITNVSALEDCQNCKTAVLFTHQLAVIISKSLILFSFSVLCQQRLHRTEARKVVSGYRVGKDAESR